MTDVELRITGNADSAIKSIGAARREFQELVKTFERPLNQINALQKTQESAKAASSAYFDARRRVDELKKAI